METELDRMVVISVIKPVSISEWASLIVPVLKRNSQIRIFRNFKQTFNPVLHIDKYLIPNIDDLHSKVSGEGHYFTRLYLRDANLQVSLEKESRRLTTINTHKGIFMHIQLCFGIASSQGVFPQIIDQPIQGIPKTVAHLDDILISRQSMEEHNAGFSHRSYKCEFKKSSIS